MKDPHLKNLIEEYNNSQNEFHETKYWEVYKNPILATINQMDINELRSGKYPILSKFGFNEIVFRKFSSFKTRLKIVSYLLWKILVKNENYRPYSVDKSDLREMAYRHCKLYGEMTGAKDISFFEVSKFGNPGDLFEINGKLYTMAFLGFYIRYCFAHKHIDFQGSEVIVELGSGSGHQLEVLKKAHKNLTILCFDLPVQIFLCEQYLMNILGKENIVSSEKTIHWKDLSLIEKGKIHFFGNWQFPLLKNFKFDVFWNAASFGEMEPKIVQNYLGDIRSNCRWIYLLQASFGKELDKVEIPIKFEDYKEWLEEYTLIRRSDAYRAYMRLKGSGGYFHAVWRLNS